MSTPSENRIAVLNQTRIVWELRCENLGLKLGTQKRMGQCEAYIQGVIAVMTSIHLMSHDEAQRVAFLVACGRAEEWLAAHRGVEVAAK